VRTLAEVWLWGSRIGAVSVEGQSPFAAFEYDRDFLSSGIQLAPLMMPLGPGIFRFEDLPRRSYHGLPGLLAGSLPGPFGERLIAAWLSSQERQPGEYNPVERLSYTGVRGLGALEFRPSYFPEQGPERPLRLADLSAMASDVLERRRELQASFTAPERRTQVANLLRVGTSAGGSRAKAALAWNPKKNQFHSGSPAPHLGFEPWLVKFSGSPLSPEYGPMEHAYAQMAEAAGIQLAPYHLHEDSGERHFMTRRFDHDPEGRRLHVQSLANLVHSEPRQPKTTSYERSLEVIRQLDLGMDTVEQQFRRIAFNLVAANTGDHPSKTHFLMARSGKWSLAPASDLVCSQDSSPHAMTLAGKRDSFTREDLRQAARTASMKRGRCDEILSEVQSAVRRWPDFAAAADLHGDWTKRIAASHRLEL
jgi:serine/threonine-protein kinase HipA